MIKKNKALDWLVHNVNFVDENGTAMDQDLVLGHTHDEDGNHVHDHSGDVADSDSQNDDQNDDTDAPSEEAGES